MSIKCQHNLVFNCKKITSVGPLLAVTPPKSTCGVSPLGSVTDQDQATNHIEHAINTE
ncbi:hypothetical protein HanRHA438_Chr03g0112821 [Helianthus annuus]|nr:hypothetical protein HanRHA438_Chr03g0112821 [Helianthus annuus]